MLKPGVSAAVASLALPTTAGAGNMGTRGTVHTT